MPTAYIKKLAKLNHTTVNKLEKFWSQAKEIAKSEGNGKAWGLITTIFQNKLKKEGYKVKAFTSLADTDTTLNNIKKSINKQTDINIEELQKIAKKLNIKNRKKWKCNNLGDKWVNYDGPITEKILIESFKEGLMTSNALSHTIDAKVKAFKESKIFQVYKDLMKGKSITLYRGISNLKKHPDLLKYLKYNLMDRNSWTTDYSIASKYTGLHKNVGIILKIECTVDDANLPLSAWLAGYWSGKGEWNANNEINLKQSFDVKNISIVYSDIGIKELGFDVDNFNKKCEAKMNKYSYNGQVITASSKEDAIQQVIASGKRPKFSEEQMYILSNIPEELDHSYDRTGKTLCIAADVNENKELDKLFKGYMICIDSDEEAKNFVEEYKSSMNDFVKIIKELGNNKFFKKLMRD